MALRIDRVIRSQDRGFQIDFSRKHNITPQAMYAWRKSGTISMENLMLLADETGVSFNWLLTGEDAEGYSGTSVRQSVDDDADAIDGEYTVINTDQNRPDTSEIIEQLGGDGFDLWDDSTPVDDDEVAVPFLIELAAGTGRYAVTENSSGRKLRFARSTLRRAGVNPDNAHCVTVSGNAMAPVLPDGAIVGIDSGSTRIRDGEMYAIDQDGLLRVKVLYMLPGGTVRVRSINEIEHPEENCDIYTIRILGRVFWWSVLKV
jgi:phage repressor protein C with HTH and peptisase S24 domain